MVRQVGDTRANQSVQCVAEVLTGKVQFDIEGKDKENLTVEEVVKRFGAKLKDESLLS